MQDFAHSHSSHDDALAFLVAWWNSGRPGGAMVHLVDLSGRAGTALLQDVHRLMPDSVLLDASGRTAEDLHTAVLRAMNVGPDRWDKALRRPEAKRLVLIANAHQAGLTRRSSEPKQLVTGSAAALSRGQAGVVVHVTPEHVPRRVDITVTVGEEAKEDQASFPDGIRALALSEPRVVPLRMWAELTRALTGCSTTETELRALAAEHPTTLRVDDGSCVRFIDDHVAERLRRTTDKQQLQYINRHMADWLRQISPEFRHPRGWAASGVEGGYAATGLAMHAVQAGMRDAPDGTAPPSVFHDFLDDGRAVANVPQRSLLDAADSHMWWSCPQNTAASDAFHLWPYGVAPTDQGEWASLLHLMATARNDHAFADAVTDSGVRLPWTAQWTQWRPPGGYHASYASHIPCDGLVEVLWKGRTVVAALEDGVLPPRMALFDPATGERVAGPWLCEDDKIPEEHLGDLAWPSGEGSGRPSPTRHSDLWESVGEGSGAHPRLLACPPLEVGPLTLLGGAGGVLAIRPAGEETGPLELTDKRPVSGPYGDMNASRPPITPIDAPPPSPADLVTLLGVDEIRRFDAGQLPADLTSEETRRTLTTFGLPEIDEGGLGIHPWGRTDRLADPLVEVPWPADVEPPEESGPFFRIGFWMGGGLVIDGPTGHVLRIPTEPEEDHLAALPAARSLQNFLTMAALWITALRVRETVHDPTERRNLVRNLYGAQLLVDEEGADAPAWSYVFDNE